MILHTSLYCARRNRVFLDAKWHDTAAMVTPPMRKTTPLEPFDPSVFPNECEKHRGMDEMLNSSGATNTAMPVNLGLTNEPSPRPHTADWRCAHTKRANSNNNNLTIPI